LKSGWVGEAVKLAARETQTGTVRLKVVQSTGETVAVVSRDEAILFALEIVAACSALGHGEIAAHFAKKAK
jgi:hypothetical protein